MRHSLLLLAAPALLAAQNSPFDAEVIRRADALAPKVAGWRHDIHQNPELSFQETRTAKLVADHLRALGLQVRTGVGGNGVVGVLVGGKPGPVVALRADMDALPVTELNELPYKSVVRTTYNGVETGVMHACGHDMHTAILMGTAELLASMKAQVPGTVKFIFQPAEEGPPRGGAGPMIEDGVLESPKVEAIYGLHVGAGPLGAISYRSGAWQASGDNFRITVHGRQTHGAIPAAGIDPIVVASQIVLGLQTIVSRQVDLTTAPLVLTVGAIHGGLRENIIPDSVWMIGTVRALDPAMRLDVHEKMKRTAQNIAEAAGAHAEVVVTLGYPVTVNQSALTAQAVPTLERIAGANRVAVASPVMPAEDFSRYQERVPGFFFSLGVTPPGIDPARATNHSPLFQGDDAALTTGVKLLSSLALDYLRTPKRVP